VTRLLLGRQFHNRLVVGEIHATPRPSSSVSSAPQPIWCPDTQTYCYPRKILLTVG
jgi:hypothetical protein